MTAYYNEIDPYAAQWLRNLIAAGHVAPGDVDERSIVDVRADELRGYGQLHFFAGIGGWSIALRLAGWPDDRPVWTGSCPCQPFSQSGSKKGFSDDRHLWPEWFRLITQCRPAIIFGEQVARATEWLGLVRGDLETLDYAVGAIPIEAASAGADHLRDRVWFVADAGSIRHKSDPAGLYQIPHLWAPQIGDRGSLFGRGRENSDQWVVGYDGKAMRIKPGILLLVDGVSHGVDKRRAFGNAIFPRAAATFITAYQECCP